MAVTSLVAQMVKTVPTMWETWALSLGQEDPLEKRNGNPLQYSCLENPMDRAWRATVHRTTKNQTQLKRLANIESNLMVPTMDGEEGKSQTEVWY